MDEERRFEIPSLKTASLTIVDIFGALVPGLVWLTLLLILIQFILDGNFTFGTGFEAELNKFSNSSVFQTAVLIAYLAVGLTVGYIAKSFAMELAGCIESIFHSILLLVRYKKRRKYKFAVKIQRRNLFTKFSYIKNGLRFPYRILHENEVYYDVLEKMVEKHSGIKSNKLPKKRTFSYCKRLIRVFSPELWEESLQLEAEVRMMGSLFLASILAWIIAWIGFINKFETRLFYFKLIIITLALVIIFGYAFSRRRREEVNYTYLNAILIGRKHSLIESNYQPTKKAF
jgi:hypothetical protein